MPVRKKDGSIRICVDYRQPNKVTVADTFPTGNIQDCIDMLSDASYVSTIDLSQGYMQVPLSPKDKEKAPFHFPIGLWQWTRMPQELKNSPASLCAYCKNYLRLFQQSASSYTWMIFVLCQIRSKIIYDVYKKSLIALDSMALKLKLENVIGRKTKWYG